MRILDSLKQKWGGWQKGPTPVMIDLKKRQDIVQDIAKLKAGLNLVLEGQNELRKEIHMIFSDITHFENMVLKILDKSAMDMVREEYH